MKILDDSYCHFFLLDSLGESGKGVASELYLIGHGLQNRLDGFRVKHRHCGESMITQINFTKTSLSRFFL